jgi:outer membrane protein, heavy metal efflux system
MNKLLISMILLTTAAFAEDFEHFLDKAIKQSPYLKAVAFGIDQAKEEGALLTRYENPSLALEYSRFEPNTGDSDNGFRANYTQPIRLWGVGDDKERLSEATLQSANANLEQKRARFIRDISLFYTRYSQQKMLVSLGDEELRIAKKIYDISKARYEAGTISRGVMLQSQVAYEMIQIQNESLSLTAMQSYYDLLKQAGIKQEIELNAEHDFVIKVTADRSHNPDRARNSKLK